MESQTLYLILALGLFLHLIGWNYAFQILFTPTDPGWTVLSVVTGLGIIIIGEIAIAAILYQVKPLDLVWFVVILIGGVALVGGPMFAVQIWKKYHNHKHSNHIKKEQDFTR